MTTHALSVPPSPIRSAVARTLVLILATVGSLVAAGPAEAAGATVSFTIRIEGIAAPVTGEAPGEADDARGDATMQLRRLLDDVGDDSDRARSALARDAVLWIDGRAFSSAGSGRVWTSGQTGRSSAHLSL